MSVGALEIPPPLSGSPSAKMVLVPPRASRTASARVLPGSFAAGSFQVVFDMDHRPGRRVAVESGQDALGTSD